MSLMAASQLQDEDASPLGSALRALAIFAPWYGMALVGLSIL